jgi:hypothetical protein
MRTVSESSKEYQRIQDDVENYFPENFKEAKAFKQFFTKDILKWISKENDAYNLSITSHLLNSYVWPSWLPDMPSDYYSDRELWLNESVKLIHILKRKADALSPGIYNMTLICKSYQDHKEFKKHFRF